MAEPSPEQARLLEQVLDLSFTPAEVPHVLEQALHAPHRDQVPAEEKKNNDFISICFLLDTHVIRTSSWTGDEIFWATSSPCVGTGALALSQAFGRCGTCDLPDWLITGPFRLVSAVAAGDRTLGPSTPSRPKACGGGGGL